MKIDKIKFDDTGIEEYKFHQNKNTILINDININEAVVSNKPFLVKNILNISVVPKILKKLDIYVYSIHK